MPSSEARVSGLVGSPLIPLRRPPCYGRSEDTGQNLYPPEFIEQLQEVFDCYGVDPTFRVSIACDLIIDRTAVAWVEYAGRRHRNFLEFKEDFLRVFWSEHEQSELLRNDFYGGHYNPDGGLSMREHLWKLARLGRCLGQSEWAVARRAVQHLSPVLGRGGAVLWLNIRHEERPVRRLEEILREFECIEQDQVGEHQADEHDAHQRGGRDAGGYDVSGTHEMHLSPVSVEGATSRRRRRHRHRGWSDMSRVTSHPEPQERVITIDVLRASNPGRSPGWRHGVQGPVEGSTRPMQQHSLPRPRATNPAAAQTHGQPAAEQRTRRTDGPGTVQRALRTDGRRVSPGKQAEQPARPAARRPAEQSVIRQTDGRVPGQTAGHPAGQPPQDDPREIQAGSSSTRAPVQQCARSPLSPLLKSGGSAFMNGAIGDIHMNFGKGGPHIQGSSYGPLVPVPRQNFQWPVSA